MLWSTLYRSLRVHSDCFWERVTRNQEWTQVRRLVPLASGEQTVAWNRAVRHTKCILSLCIPCLQPSIYHPSQPGSLKWSTSLTPQNAVNVLFVPTIPPKLFWAPRHLHLPTTHEHISALLLADLCCICHCWPLLSFIKVSPASAAGASCSPGFPL